MSSSDRGDDGDDDPILAHAKVRGEVGRKLYAPPVVEQAPEPVLEPTEEAPAKQSEPVVAEPEAQEVSPTSLVVVPDTRVETEALLAAAKADIERIRRNREEELLLLAILDA